MGDGHYFLSLWTIMRTTQANVNVAGRFELDDARLVLYPMTDSRFPGSPLFGEDHTAETRWTLMWLFLSA